MPCECFDHLPARLLAESHSVRFEKREEGLIATFRCHHGRTRRHLIVPGTVDWKWASHRCGEGIMRRVS